MKRKFKDANLLQTTAVNPLPLRVLVTGTASLTGYNTVVLLAGRVEYLIGIDPDEANPAEEFCRNVVVPRATDPGYMDKALALCQTHRIQLVIPTNDFECRKWFSLAQSGRPGLPAVNGAGTNAVGFLDKLRTSQLLEQAGVATPEVIPWERAPQECPLVGRSRMMGTTAKFSHIIRSRKNFHAIWPRKPRNLILTRYLNGEEFSIDLLAAPGGHLVTAVPRLRRVVKNGLIHHGVVLRDESLLREAAQLARKLSLFGIHCVQCIRDAHTGTNYYFEINPRPGSGLDMTAAAGPNLPLLLCQILCGLSPTPPDPDWGLNGIRHHATYFFKSKPTH
jgi:carbamoyl-phosphate synthase large subunit